MTPRRNGLTDGTDFDAHPTPPADPLSALPLLRAAGPGAGAGRDGPAAPAAPDEKMSLFWRVFGGTILSIIALAGMTLFNNVMTSISELRTAVERANEARTQAVADLRADLAKSTEARADLVRKDEFASRCTGLWDRVQGLQAQNTTQNAALTSVQTELAGLKDRLNRDAADLAAFRKEQAAAVEAVRKELTAAVDGLKRDEAAAGEAAKKEQAAAVDAVKKEAAAAVDGVKKEVAAVEVLKERLAAATADLKAVRDDLAKLRGEVDRNAAYDVERRDRRDVQYRQIDEALRELRQAVQDSREKVARLEAVVAQPAKPPAPAAPPPADAPPAK